MPDSDYRVRIRTQSKSLIFQWPCEDYTYLDRKKTVGAVRQRYSSNCFHLDLSEFLRTTSEK